MDKSLRTRLSLVRQLFDQAKLVAMTAGPLSASIAVCISQDALELLLSGLLEHWRVPWNDGSFNKLVDAVDKNATDKKLPSLGDLSLLTQLNKARVNIKHHAILLDEQQARDLVFRGFRAASDASLKYLKVDLESFSLADLVSRHRIRTHLVSAGGHLKHDSYKESCIDTAKAFTLMFGFAGGKYEDIGLEGWKTDRMTFGGYVALGESGDPHSKLAHAANMDFKKVGELGRQLTTRIELLELGVNHRQLVRFRRLVPTMGLSQAGTIIQTMSLNMDQNTREDAEFCLTFSTDAIIRAQEFTWGHGIQVLITDKTVCVRADTDLVIWPEPNGRSEEILASVSIGTPLSQTDGSHDIYTAVAFEDERCFVRTDLLEPQQRT
jgi:hypothetical protein